jgi:aryl-alcohol dehydrogenase-like predicted oxidoreductase
MFTRQLGRSGITVSAVGFGCWPIGGPILGIDKKTVGWEGVNDAESIRAIHRALDLGVTFFDTSDVYGRSEDLLGRAFKDRRDQVVIATKFGKLYDRERHAIIGADCSPEHMRQALEGSLRRLQTDTIDLYQLHVGDGSLEEAVPLREALEEQVRAGKIRAYAWSTDDMDRVRVFAEGPNCAAVQQHLNVFEGNRALLAFCEQHNLASVNRGPLAMGLLTGKYTANSVLPVGDVRGVDHDWLSIFKDGKPNPDFLARLDLVRDVLTSQGRTLAQGALAWLWGLSENTIPIPGFKNVQQAEENARAMDFGPLTPAEMAQIDQLLQREPAS